MGAVRPVIADEFIRLLAQQRGGQFVGEDDRLVIDDQVGGAGGGRGQGGLAGQIPGLLSVLRVLGSSEFLMVSTPRTIAHHSPNNTT